MKNKIKFPGFMSFIASPAGRYLRVVAGVIIVFAGLRAEGTGGFIIGVIGLVPLLAGSFDKCVIAPLLGGNFDGSIMRKELHEQEGHPELGTKSKTWLKA